MIRFATDMIIDSNKAIPNPSISNEEPIIESVKLNVIALTTNKKSPSVTTVTGRVKIINIGRTSMFNTDKTKLAVMAAPTPES